MAHIRPLIPSKCCAVKVREHGLPRRRALVQQAVESPPKLATIIRCCVLRDFVNPRLDPPSARVVNASVTAQNGIHHEL